MDEGHALAKEAHFSNSRKIADSIKNGVSRFKPKKSLFRGPQGGVPPRGEGGVGGGRGGSLGGSQGGVPGKYPLLIKG